jgi:trimeric autotransporter adhesin
MWIQSSSFALAFAATLLMSASQSQAQTESSTPTAPAASAPTAVPALVPYSATAIAADGKPLTGETSITFLIFKREQGGEPLFTETQTVTTDRFGEYRVQLGASLSNGIPIDLFASGEARWLEVQIAREQPQPRVLLVSVPYALTAAEAATLGGLPASA